MKAEEDEKIAGFDWPLVSAGMTLLFGTTVEVVRAAQVVELVALALRRLPNALPPKAEVEEVNPVVGAVEEDTFALDVGGFELKDENAFPFPTAGVVDLSELLELAAP